MNNKLISYKKVSSVNLFDIKIVRKKGFLNRPRLFFYDSTNKLLGFFDIIANIYDFGNKCFIIKTQKHGFHNEFQFQFALNFIDNRFYVDMKGYLTRHNKKKYIKGSFNYDGKTFLLNSKLLEYYPEDCVKSKKNIQFYLNSKKFFKIYKTKSKHFKIIYDEVIDKNLNMLVSMIVSCLFLKNIKS